MKKKSKFSLQTIGRYAWRLLLAAFLGIVLFGITAFGALYLVIHGPSKSARNLLIATLEETSRGPVIARWFLSDEEVRSITAGIHKDTEENIDKDMIQLPSHREDPSDLPSSGGDIPSPSDPSDGSSGDTNDKTSGEFLEDGLELVRISSGAYKGALLIVEDPTRVFVGARERYNSGQGGWEVNEFVENFNATAGMNAGGFEDSGGQGNGGTPTGLVIKDGKIVWGSKSASYSICGFDADGLLYVGYMTGAKALQKGIVSACSYGPALIMNGVPCNKNGSFGSGRNPRTAIGQRADGAILMLVIEGRQVDSLGATYDELVEILYSYGAVNATNLDGGSSTIMYYGEQQVIRPSTIASVSRGVATAILVK